MKIMKIIPIDKREKYRCHFCGTNKSVKYITEIIDPVIDNKPTKVTVCNKCVLIYCSEKMNGSLDDVQLPKVKQPKSNRTIECKLDRDLEDIFISAIRYSIGRQTYMPSIVIGYINPKLQYLSDRFLEVTKKDIEDQAIYGGKHPYGDPKIDKPLWDRFYQNIVDEINNRKEGN